ncbi:hypothetical protein [Nocardiopsis ganjiahuensis]|uniref:hypothetical protein n=1 Tax=Nocardiopsis ganjiahuensis TaxID=239984 RepID=UPI001360B6A8|nr:hypothetical protein [Nocardiopsis ganjiahuensis]
MATDAALELLPRLVAGEEVRFEEADAAAGTGRAHAAGRLRGRAREPGLPRA